MQLGKTYKVIGTLYIITNNPGEARDYLMRAHAIFEAKGQVKLLKEVKNKLKMLNSCVKISAEVAAAEAVDSGDNDSPDGSPEQQKPKAISFGKKKGAAKKKKKGRVIRDNFVREA